MYLTPELLRGIERRFGTPVRGTAAAAFNAREFDLLVYCGRKNRAHDVTLFIRDGGRFAVIRKPSYPPEVFRPPSGGVEPGESFEAGAAREAEEETGLHAELERYLLRIEACFRCEGREAAWTTHVVLARAAGGTLAPVDRREIAEARWASVAEMTGRYRTAMLAVGSAGMRYRVELQDAALRLLGLADPSALEDEPVIRLNASASRPAVSCRDDKPGV
jgi:ADP-ribose pyrophosphatase YjhB (NUDIX family)